MRKTKLEKGITLIALIITIVVLLILAVVSIGAIKNSKIISHSQNAADEWKKAQEDENKLLEGYLEQIESSIKGDDNEDDETVTKKDPISTTDTYIGYYADVDGNGTVDGIIYADLAADGSGKWYDDDGAYSYSKKTTLNNYYISQESYQYKEFNANPVLAPIDLEKDTVEENDRFYVMALENFTTKDYTTFYWYYNAYGNMSDYETTTSTAFGTGKTNTATMMTKVYGDGLKDGDIWKYINSEVEKGWFIPSSGEWGAFGTFATSEEMSTSNYSNYGLSNFYWSSSQDDTSLAWLANFIYGFMYGSDVSNSLSVRLSTTF